MTYKRLSALVFCFLLSFPSAASALDGVFVGGELGAIGLKGTAGTAIGFGLDLGVRTNSLLDVMFRLQASSHTGVSVYSQTLSADVHYAEVNDFDFTVGAGPGFYFFKAPGVTNTNFGLNAGTGVDVKVEDALHLGVHGRYHLVFGTGADNYWSVMMRIGYLFGT